MKKLFATFLFLVVALVTLTLFVGVQKTKEKQIVPIPHPHMYGNEKLPIETIHITIFYFVPKGGEPHVLSNWKDFVQPHLDNVIDFHSSVFSNASHISYTYFPEILVGEKSEKEYENFLKEENTTNHETLLPIKEEITKRVLSQEGDLHTKLEKDTKKYDREVYLVIYEGLGAAGNDDFCLVSRSYLTDKAYSEFASTFLAHEFYHTLGIPDNYQKSTFVYKDNQQVDISLLTKKDIMGQVSIPLVHTYLDYETLQKMGL